MSWHTHQDVLDVVGGEREVGRAPRGVRRRVRLGDRGPGVWNIDSRRRRVDGFDGVLRLVSRPRAQGVRKTTRSRPGGRRQRPQPSPSTVARGLPPARTLGAGSAGATAGPSRSSHPPPGSGRPWKRDPRLPAVRRALPRPVEDPGTTRGAPRRTPLRRPPDPGPRRPLGERVRSTSPTPSRPLLDGAALAEPVPPPDPGEGARLAAAFAALAGLERLLAAVGRLPA